MYWKNSFQSRNEFARIITPDGLVKSGPFKFLPVFHCSWSFQLLSTDYKKADLLKCTKMYTQNGPITNYLIYIHYIRQFFIKPYWFVISLKCKIALAFDLIAALSSARLVRVISAQLRYLKSKFQSWALMCSWLQMVLSKFLSWHCIRVIFFYFDKNWYGKKLLQSHVWKFCQ